jgi:CheY-like chemotaxis protein
VDPQDQFRRLLKMRLLNEGLEVDEAATYEKALEHMLKTPPDIVLVDVDADSSEAFQLLQEMQQDGNLCRLPIAFLAQRPNRILKIRALRQGVDDFFSKTDDMEEIVVRVENILVREAIRTEGETRRNRRGITGDLENLGLPDIIQTLTIGMKTACVSVASGDRSGKIWFENGTPRHTETNVQVGEDAFYEMVRWTTGEFVIEHGLRCKQRSLTQDAMFLLMEGLRLMDEGSAQAAS